MLNLSMTNSSLSEKPSLEFSMRPATLIIAAALGIGPWATSLAQNGLTSVIQTEAARPTSWSPLQARLSLSTAWHGGGSLSVKRVSGLSVLGDYYFQRTNLTRPLALSINGFRVTSGLVFGQVSPPLLFGSGTGLVPTGVQRARHSTVSEPELGQLSDAPPVPYLGLGYSSGVVGGGWEFIADIGLLAQSDTSRIRFGRAPGVVGLGQKFDDIVRELRYTTLLQIGVSYSF